MNRILEHRLSTTLILSLLVTAIVGLIDHFTGYELGFFVFYFIPIGFAAWSGGRLSGMLLSGLCALTWFLIDTTSGHPYSSEWFGLWNTGIRLIAFLVVTVAASEVRQLLVREHQLSSQLQATLNEVEELQGLLPICASCKKIRNDQGYWEQIEWYISSHSKAEFTHGICPDCAKQLYPEIFGDEATTSSPGSTVLPQA